MSQTTFSADDKKWMLRAIALAAKGRYSTTPNPNVGAVIIDKNGSFAGEGYHQKSGEPHAEVFALRQAKEKAKEGTCFVTLEPCSHIGKTPPCADALIEAGLSRVVIACVDPNPLVNQRGIKKLRQANIQVDIGLCKQEAAEINRGFFYKMLSGIPWLTIKLASSLDGKTALANGESKWITGSAARADVQDLRAQHCAILSGADTVIADNPKLNVRPAQLSEQAKEAFLLRQKQPLRVLIDGKNRLNDSYQLFNDSQPVLVFNHQENKSLCQPQTQQIQVEYAPNSQYLCLLSILKRLAELNINSVWLEAGASLSGALFDQELAQELVLYQAPKILGAGARDLTNTQLLSDLNGAIDLKLIDSVQIGEDTRQRFLIQHAQSAKSGD